VGDAPAPPQTLSPNPIKGLGGGLEESAGNLADEKSPASLKNQAFKAPRSEIMAYDLWPSAGLWRPVLEDARLQGKLRLRTMHGDPKGQQRHAGPPHRAGRGNGGPGPRSKPGLCNYDIGDGLRSGCKSPGAKKPGTGKWCASNRNCAGRCFKATFPWPAIFSTRPIMPICMTPSPAGVRAGD